MDSFVFALDTTMPVFLVILLGWFLRRVGVLNEAFCKPADHYVFKCALPVSLFLSIAKMDVYSDFDPMFCLFCFTVTAIVFLGVWALTSRLMKDKALVGEFSQAAVRSSAAILGVALNTNIYGNAGMVPMMVLSAVPFFNVYAVLILQFSPHTDENGRLIPPERNGAAAVKRALVNVVKNPIILGILLGVLMTFRNPIIKAILRLYLEFIRIMPQMVLLFLVYFGTTRAFGWNLSGETASIIVFVLWGTAEMSDLVRGALIAIPKHQYESAEALGMSRIQTYWYIVIPQTVRRLIPLSINLITRMIKTTSLVLMIGVVEVIKVAQQIIEANRTASPNAAFGIYLTVFVLYFLACWPISLLASYLEKKWK